MTLLPFNITGEPLLPRATLIPVEFRDEGLRIQAQAQVCNLFRGCLKMNGPADRSAGPLM